jgi:CelD/BcsL family acetyltransferase involved in cellulose biosynthesis
MMMPGKEGSPSFCWIEGEADINALRPEWDSLAARTGADVYLRPLWQSVWWENFGAACARREPRHVLTVRQNGRLVAVLPFILRRFVMPVSLDVACIAGTDPHTVVLRLPIEEEMLAPVLAQALDDLTGRFGCAAVSFTPLSALAVHGPALRKLMGDPSTGFVMLERPEGTHVMFDLPDRFTDWLAALPKKRRAQYRRDRMHLEQTFGITRDHSRPDKAQFRDFVDFHNRQWQSAGKGGHFEDWANSAGFYQDLAERQTADGPIHLFHVCGQDGMLASQFSLVEGDTAHWRLPARTLDPQLEKYSIGKIGLIDMIECMIGLGVRRIEAGRGDYGYKLLHGGTSVGVSRFLAVSEPKRHCVALLLIWADVLNFVYYRVWFLRLAPQLRARLGLRHRPLLKIWQRTRL